jgi:hypothetical protein
MKITSHFRNIKDILIRDILSAEKEIVIAVSWFTNQDIYNALLSRTADVESHLIILNDDINNRIDGLNFQEFIDLGGKFYFGKQENPMHNKFCIVDTKILISGSFNYTYLAETINEENVLRISGIQDVIEKFRQNFFTNLIADKNLIKSVSDYLLNNPAQRNLFSFQNYGIRDIYQHSIELRENGNVELASKIVSKLVESSQTELSDNFIIKDVIYRQWKQNYFADIIQVNGDKIIVTYRTVTDTAGCWVHGPKTNHCWLLRNTNNNLEYVKAKRITNIKVNGKVIIPNAKENTIYYFTKNIDEANSDNSDLGYSWDDKKRLVDDKRNIIPIEKIIVDSEFELSCEIHFESRKFKDMTVDLIEGFEKYEIK